MCCMEMISVINDADNEVDQISGVVTITHHSKR